MHYTPVKIDRRALQALLLSVGISIFVICFTALISGELRPRLGFLFLALGGVCFLAASVLHVPKAGPSK